MSAATSTVGQVGQVAPAARGSGSSSLLGYGLYFIDVFACLLFCIVLALIGARFGKEHSVDVELPRAEPAASAGSDLSGTTIALRDGQIWLDDQMVSFEQLGEHLANAPPPSVVIRAEDSALSRVIGAAHGAGVHQIRLAYESVSAAPAATEER